MTRPRVPPDQRQRTAQACESCKRRKQKCNGLCPCNTCEKRKFVCVYADREHVPSPTDSSGLKRKMADVDMEDAGDTDSHGAPESEPRQPKSPRLLPTRTVSDLNGQGDPPNFEQIDQRTGEHVPQMQQFAQAGDEEGASRMSRATTTSGDEEAIVYSQTRMLQDPTGRLLYIGDSGTLSYLQLIRMMVESVSGPSDFTTDPRRHKIVESSLSLPSQFRPTHLLPDRTTANTLAEAFFVNTHGLVQIFDREAFFLELSMCYDNPLAVGPEYLCLKNLVFAIGLMLATPRPGTNEAIVVEALRAEPYDRSEIFYQNAKSLSDPLTGFEDADFWSIQALLLMAIYMQTKSKRNAAFALVGMAVRSAYALGLHREETMVIFSPEDRKIRRNVWKSLFVMDRFLSCSLGRPTAISEEECSGDTLKPPEPSATGEGFKYESGFAATFNQIASLGLEAAVRSCSVIGTILKRVYQHRKIGTKLAQEIADVCKLWPKALAPILHWRQAAAASPSQGMAILHVNLFYCHSIVLLTRPFFLYILNDKVQQMLAPEGNPDAAPSSRARMAKFMEACIIASTHTVKLVQQAFDAGYLPRRDPTVIYFLFSASLILLSTEYAMLYSNTTDQYIRQSITMMNYCAETDPQASRLSYIMTTFKDVVAQHRERKAQEQQQNAAFRQNDGASQAFVSPAVTAASVQSSAPDQFQSSDIFTQYHNSGLPNTGFNNQQFAVPTSGSPSRAHEHHRHNSASTLPSIANLTTPTPTSATPATAPNALPTAPPSLSHEFSFSSLLDMSALDGARLGQHSGEDLSSGPDEQIDFDALWAWPTPAVGTPTFGGMSGGEASAHNSVPPMGHDPTIPLYRVVDG